jgi:hypothetical protein
MEQLILLMLPQFMSKKFYDVEINSLNLLTHNKMLLKKCHNPPDSRCPNLTQKCGYKGTSMHGQNRKD